jgi:serine/threonine protein kinase
LLDIIENDPDRLSPEDVNKLLQKILEALSYIHGHDILHRDISPDNIIIDHDNLPVLIDFGAARESATRVSRVLSKVLTVKDGYSPQEFYLAGSDQLVPATSTHWPPPSTTWSAARRRRRRIRAWRPRRARRSTRWNHSARPRATIAHFIDAINSCLSVFPKDRLQSAASWRDMIDHDRRQQLLLQEAEQDVELEEHGRKTGEGIRTRHGRARAQGP